MSNFFHVLESSERQRTCVVRRRRLGVALESFSDTGPRVVLRGQLLYDVEKHPKQMGTQEVQALLRREEFMGEGISRYRRYEQPTRIVILLVRDDPVGLARLTTSMLWAGRPPRGDEVMCFGRLERNFKVQINKRFVVRARDMLGVWSPTALRGTPALLRSASIECLFENETVQEPYISCTAAHAPASAARTLQPAASRASEEMRGGGGGASGSGKLRTSVTRPSSALNANPGRSSSKRARREKGPPSTAYTETPDESVNPSVKAIPARALRASF
ncbi:Hypothetical Protein FCC1311_048432 [Hondaea fermentalgiana]|uniref:Uncharacterized protein n=1 Tax=Hondaea fermentalgiana TaxID=2315210 RepID=A0A2R5GCB2_9STRA|nr:Hypothetical Protein FCC1311_048432 [Hondaea fermentalgiana]|eukprot:GBG28622.1 Hypothetical Protein FCC1311_048432 [Hondaea fermentalgiana]